MKKKILKTMALLSIILYFKPTIVANSYTSYIRKATVKIFNTTSKVNFVPHGKPEILIEQLVQVQFYKGILY